MTWLDDELTQRKGKTSFLTLGIGLFLIGVFLIPLLLSLLQGLSPAGSDGATLPVVVAIGLAPFLVWFVVGAARGFR